MKTKDNDYMEEPDLKDKFIEVLKLAGASICLAFCAFLLYIFWWMCYYAGFPM